MRPARKRTLALRDRLAFSFACALVLAYALIAICAVVVVDRSIARSVDGRLATVADAVLTIAGDERDEIDRKDREQFASITADASGALVIAADGALVLGTTDTIAPWAAAARRTAPSGRAFITRNDGHAVRAIVDRRRLHDGTETIVVWQSMQLVDDLEGIVRLVLGGCSFAVAAVGYAVGAQLARRGLLPLSRITAVIADIAAHDLSRRLGPQPHADELGGLAATFDRMLDRLQAAFERQRRFTADASHDLRAPLATLRAEVDLALRRERTNAQYRAALEAIAADADHLDRLIDSLLTSARSDAGDITLGPLDLAAVACAAVAQIAPLAQARQVTIRTQLPAGITIGGERDLLERAVLATLHNAVKYTPPGGSIDVEGRAETGGAQLAIRDEGPGFSAPALEHAFDRFWRDDPARGRGGSGLGLAIAQSIVQRCGGGIRIANAGRGGAEVTMRFCSGVNEPAAAADGAIAAGDLLATGRSADDPPEAGAKYRS